MSDGIVVLYRFHYGKQKQHTRALVNTIKTIAWLGYLMVYQKIAKNIETMIDKKEYDIHYALGTQLYKVRFCLPPKGPKHKKVLQVIDHCDNDVTGHIIQYMGPNQDWHGIEYTPHRLGYDQLTLNTSNGKSLVFEKNEVIEVN